MGCWGCGCGQSRHLKPDCPLLKKEDLKVNKEEWDGESLPRRFSSSTWCSRFKIDNPILVKIYWVMDWLAIG